MMDEITRKVFERLLENTYVDEPVRTLDSEDVPADSWMRRNGFAYFPLFGESNRENDGAYKMMAERYLLKYVCAGHTFERSRGRLYLNPYPALDADALIQSYIINRDQLRREGDRPWSEIGAERFLVRTVGSVRLRGDGEMYYDDSRESREEWVLEQALRSYEKDCSDPLELLEDGYLWRGLLERSAQSEEPVMWTFMLRRLRGRYKMRLVLTAEGMSMRGSKDGLTKFRVMLSDEEFRWWLSKAREDMRRRLNGTCRVGAAAGIAAGMGDIGREAGAAVRAGASNDDAARRTAARFAAAVEGGGERGENPGVDSGGGRQAVGADGVGGAAEGGAAGVAVPGAASGDDALSGRAGI